MNRCDHCEYRNSWDCEDYKVSNNKACDRFKLDFDSLSKRQQKAIQKMFMDNDSDNSYWYD